MIYNIINYGALSGDNNLNTVAIQNTINDCSQNGGGTVVVPSGKFITGTIYLRSNVELHLEMGAVLQASTNRADYNTLDAYPENYEIPQEAWDARHLIVARSVENVAITGLGTINGSADVFFEGGELFKPTPGRPTYRYGIKFQKGYSSRMEDPEVLRPGQCVVFVSCKNIRIIDISIINTTCWGLFIHGCENVQVRGYKAYNDRTFANTDGLDIDTCKNVVVSDCIIDTGDDAIAIRCDSKHLTTNGMDTCENITITNCVLSSSSCAFRMGVGIGIIKNITISNIIIPRGGIAFEIHSQYWLDDHVSFENIFIRDIICENTTIPFNLCATKDCSLKNISFRNFYAKCYNGAVVVAKERGTFANITVHDMRLIIVPAPFTIPVLDMDGNNMLLDIKNREDVTLERVNLEVHDEIKALFKDACKKQI